jgi:nucleotidyltransferase substrate binding protein (TIGR01987 family)
MSRELLLEALASFETALGRLEEALALPKTDITRDATIQRFEFTIELAWKTVARFAREQGQTVETPRQAFRTAFKLGWVADDTVWMAMVEDRNRTRHTYSEALADALYSRLFSYAKALRELIPQLQATVASDD